jgi:membrane-associated phospholipid phosphatase
MISIRESLTCAALVCSLGFAAPAFAQTPAAAPPSQAESNAFSRFFTTTINDFRRLPSKDTMTWLVIGGTAAAAGHPHDWEISDGLSGVHSMDEVFKPGATIGGARAQMAGAITTFVVGKVSGKPRVASLGADFVRAQIMAQALTAGIKLTARRHRPDGGEYSFPSGHTSVTFATATVVQRHFGWKAGVPAYALASYVATSRVHVKRHFTSDVAFGAALGIISGRTVTIGRGRARFAMSPAASSQRAGVSLTLIDRP